MKQARRANHPVERGKVARQTCMTHDSTDHRLFWQFGDMDMEGPFGWKQVIGRDVFRDEIFPKLRHFESMTWENIPGKQHHAIKVKDLSKEAQDRLKEINMDDIEEVFSFALNGRNRMIGTRDRNVFRILWWDANHHVCPSHLKHT